MNKAELLALGRDYNRNLYLLKEAKGRVAEIEDRLNGQVNALNLQIKAILGRSPDSVGLRAFTKILEWAMEEES